MGADFYESDAELADGRSQGQPPIGIGSQCVIDGAIIDKNCHIGDGVHIGNPHGVVDSPDHDQCMIRDGIPVVLKGAVLPSGWNCAEMVTAPPQ